MTDNLSCPTGRAHIGAQSNRDNHPWHFLTDRALAPLHSSRASRSSRRWKRAGFWRFRCRSTSNPPAPPFLPVRCPTPAPPSPAAATATPTAGISPPSTSPAIATTPPLPISATTPSSTRSSTARAPGSWPSPTGNTTSTSSAAIRIGSGRSSSTTPKAFSSPAGLRAAPATGSKGRSSSPSATGG